MKNNLFLQGLSAILFIALAIVFLNPFHIWMTSMAHMSVLGLLIASLATFIILIVNEQGGDERDFLHRMQAGRVAFLLGSVTLILGTGWQAFHGAVDPWLLISLSFMVAGKTLTRFYTQMRG